MSDYHEHAAFPLERFTKQEWIVAGIRATRAEDEGDNYEQEFRHSLAKALANRGVSETVQARAPQAIAAPPAGSKPAAKAKAPRLAAADYPRIIAEAEAILASCRATASAPTPVDAAASDTLARAFQTGAYTPGAPQVASYSGGVLTLGTASTPKPSTPRAAAAVVAPIGNSAGLRPSPNAELNARFQVAADAPPAPIASGGVFDIGSASRAKKPAAVVSESQWAQHEIARLARGDQ